MLTASADCIEVTERAGQALATEAGWLEAAELSPDAWPLSTTDAAKVLFTAGFRCSADELARLGTLGMVPAVELWDCRDLMAAGAALDARRQWRWGCCDEKKTTEQAIFEQHLTAGPDAMQLLRDQLKTDIRLALVLLAECHDRSTREKLLVTVSAILACDHGVLF